MSACADLSQYDLVLRIVTMFATIGIVIVIFIAGYSAKERPIVTVLLLALAVFSLLALLAQPCDFVDRVLYWYFYESQPVDPVRYWEIVPNLQALVRYWR